jgi:hypothetical protein
MRSLQLSDSTYAALWAKWEEGDDGEEGVLRRILGLQGKPVPAANGNGKPYRDPRYGVEFPPGFEIFRTYKGKEYRAVVKENGLFHNITTNRTATSLNQLSGHIGAPTENAWLGWNFQNGSRARPIAELRDPGKIKRRS